MRIVGSCVFAVLLPGLVSAQPAQSEAAGTLRITVTDPSGAVIVGARVAVKPSGAAAGGPPGATDGRGDAVFSQLRPGRYAIHVEAEGFEPQDIEVRVRAGYNRREIRLKIARLAETGQVTRDPRERASDPRSDAFATILGQTEINELPDDPDEMEPALNEMAGPRAPPRAT